jgi:hypothetical protein
MRDKCQYRSHSPGFWREALRNVRWDSTVPESDPKVRDNAFIHVIRVELVKNWNGRNEAKLTHFSISSGPSTNNAISLVI